MPLRDPDALPLEAPHASLQAPRIIERLSPYLSPQRQQRIAEVVNRRLASVTLVLERPYDPHNGAAVLRSAEAFGLLHLHVIAPEGGFSFSPKVTQSCDKWLDVYLHRSTSACLSFLRRAGFVCWAACPPSATRGEPSSSPEGISVECPTALVFGNEHAGLSEEAITSCDHRFRLAMHGFSESLNLSVSAALALRDVVSRRRLALGREGDLPNAARERLTAAYYVRSTPHAIAVLTKALRLSKELGL